MSESNDNQNNKVVIKNITLKEIKEKPVAFNVEDENILIIERPNFEVSK